MGRVYERCCLRRCFFFTRGISSSVPTDDVTVICLYLRSGPFFYIRFVVILSVYILNFEVSFGDGPLSLVEELSWFLEHCGVNDGFIFWLGCVCISGVLAASFIPFTTYMKTGLSVYLRAWDLSRSFLVPFYRLF